MAPKKPSKGTIAKKTRRLTLNRGTLKNLPVSGPAVRGGVAPLRPTVETHAVHGNCI